jgi:hypothetical protein
MMAEATTGSGNNSLSFIVGGLVVAVAIGAFMYYNGYIGGHVKTTTEQSTTSPSPDGASTTTTTTKSTTP